MKGRIKKGGFYIAAAAALLMTALLVTNCIEPMGTLDMTDSPLQTRSGYLTLGVETSESFRTIFPTMPTTFASYRIEATATGGGTSANLNVTTWGSPQYMPLDTGTYTIKVIAFKSAAQADPIAVGQTTGVSVGAGGGSTTITLHEINNEGTGNFEWEFTLPVLSGTDTANLAFTPSGGGAATVAQINFNTGGSVTGNQNINSGWYEVVLSINQDNHLPFKIAETVYIFQNMESKWGPKTYTPIKNAFDVTYDVGVTGTWTDAPSADTITGHPGNTTLTAPSDPTTSTLGETFQGWFTGDGSPSWGNEWLFGSGGTPVISDLTLYARYGTQPNLTITLTEGFLDEVPVTPSIAGLLTVLQEDILFTAGALATTITISNVLSDGLTIVNWRYNNVQIQAAGNSYTVDFKANTPAGIIYPGTHYITVHATSGDGSALDPTMHWSAIIEITVTPLQP